MRFWNVILVVCLASSLSAAEKQSTGPERIPSTMRGQVAAVDPLQGSWDIIITGSPYRILRSVSPVGVVDAYAFPAFTTTVGSIVAGPGHGTWVKLSTGVYAAAVDYFQIDIKTGLLDSIGRVTEVITMGSDGNSYTSTFKTQVYSPAGALLLTNPGATSATRISVDSQLLEVSQ